MFISVTKSVGIRELWPKTRANISYNIDISRWTSGESPTRTLRAPTREVLNRTSAFGYIERLAALRSWLRQDEPLRVAGGLSDANSVSSSTSRLELCAVTR